MCSVVISVVIGGVLNQSDHSLKSLAAGRRNGSLYACICLVELTYKGDPLGSFSFHGEKQQPNLGMPSLSGALSAFQKTSFSVKGASATCKEAMPFIHVELECIVLFLSQNAFMGGGERELTPILVRFHFKDRHLEEFVFL